MFDRSFFPLDLILMASVSEVVAGRSKYIAKEVEGRACYVLEADPTNLDFTFQEKFDKATGSSFFVNVSHRIKVWELPDVTALPPMEDVPAMINIMCTKYTPIEATGTTDPTFAPEVLPVEITANHCWVALPDTLRRRYFFVNAGSGAQRTELPASTDFAQRITRMYKQYKIGDEESLLAFLTDFAGREDEGLQKLVDDFGDEDSKFLEVKDKVVATIRKFDPKRVHKVCKLLDDHEDMEDELLSKLAEKYGSLPLSYRERVTAMFQKYDADRVGEVSSFMSRFAGKEVALLSALVNRYGPEPPQPGAILSEEEAAGEKVKEGLRERAMYMFLKYAPDRDVTNAFEDATLQYDSPQSLLDALVSKHGAEPSVEERAKLLKTIVDVEKVPPNLVHEPFRNRLVAFLSHYNPKKVENVDKMLVRYSGHEEELMEQLVAKYGPEPTMERAVKQIKVKKEEEQKHDKGSKKSKRHKTGENSEPATPIPDANTAPTSPGNVSPICVPSVGGDLVSDPITIEPATFAVTTVDEAVNINEVPPSVDIPPLQVSTPPPISESPVLVAEPTSSVSPQLEPEEPKAPTPPKTPRFQLSKEELKIRCLNLLMVHEPEMIPMLQYVVGSVKNGEDTLYKELLEKYGSDPAPELVELAKVVLDASATGGKLVEEEVEERKRLSADEQHFRLQVLSSELLSARAREAALRERDEARIAEANRQWRLEAEALQNLEEAEERRRISERAASAALDKTEFAEGLSTALNDKMVTDEISLDVDSGLQFSHSAGVSLVQPSARSTMTLIGTLAALEEKLQRAYNTMEASIRKGDLLRVSNAQYQQEIRDLQQLIRDKETELKLALVDAQNQAEKQMNENERSRLDVLKEEHEHMTQVMASIHAQQAEMNSERLRMAQETRQLREEIDKERDVTQTQERTIRTLEAKVHRCMEDELASRAAIRLLEERLAMRPQTDEAAVQTQSEEELFASLAAISPPRSRSDPHSSSPYSGSSVKLLGYRDQSPASPSRGSTLRDSVTQMEAELEEWRRRVASLRDETETARHERRRAQDEYASALRVISILRSKNKKLEDHVKDLELKVLSATSPIRPVADVLQIESPNANHQLMDGFEISLTTKQLRIEATELRERLRASDAESRALKREIMDLRGLLAIKMASPKR